MAARLRLADVEVYRIGAKDVCQHYVARSLRQASIDARATVFSRIGFGWSLRR